MPLPKNLVSGLLQTWRSMPSYYKVDWGDYVVRIQPTSVARIAFLFLTQLKRDIMPVFDGTDLEFDLRGYRKNRLSEPRLGYEWVVCNEDTGKQLSSGSGEIIIQQAGRVSVKLKAIKPDSITVLGKYTLKIRLSSSLRGTGSYLTASRFTVRDWDDFSKDVIWPVMLGLLLTAIGGVIGWFLRGG